MCKKLIEGAMSHDMDLLQIFIEIIIGNALLFIEAILNNVDMQRINFRSSMSLV